MAEEDKLKAERLKDEGNKELKLNNLAKAIELYTDAIRLDPTNHVYYSNRSAAFAKDKKYEEALSDGKKCVELKPDWAKGYSRLGAALSFLHLYEEAEEVYKKGLKLEPSNAQLKQGLDDAVANSAGNPMDNPFATPDLFARLHANPKTRAYLQQPDYLQMLEVLKRNPRELGSKLQDPRIMETIGVLLGIPTTTGEEPSEPAPRESPKAKKEPEVPKPEPMEQEPEPDIKQSLEEKQLGNAAYKKKDFEKALEHYNKAIELDATNATFYTNKAAVFFEQGKFDECIELCHEAVDIGRKNAAGFALIAKAFLRIANAYLKQKKYEEAKIFYDKSLLEKRTPEALQKSQEVEKIIQEMKRKAYIDPEKAEEERLKGNECFKAGDFPKALKHYTEAIKRNPDDAKLYSNRAGCYHKLAGYGLGLEDCETCIKLDPSFVKGYTRKGGLLFALKRFSEAIEVYQKALQLDPNNREAMEGIRACQEAYANVPQDKEEIKQRAMADPEVQQILQDPGMKIILEQMQEDPKAAQDHLKNPDILRKVQKLMDVGILQIR